jgi:HD-GYP domain-containing protein (c-di-GMP phosphodiesterase class II)
MTSDRPYREALSLRRAIAEVQAGGQFDPRVAEALIEVVEGAGT